MSDFEVRMKDATERAESDFAEGIVREPLTAFRVSIEHAMLAKQKGLNNWESRVRLVDFLNTKTLTVQDYRLLPNREKLDLVRQAFAD